MSSEDVFERWAEAYALIHGPDGKEKKSDDLSFYAEAAEAVDGSVLEVGCGTGRVYLHLLERGHDVYGLDNSHRQLEVLSENAAEMGLHPEVRKGDMREFELDREFELVLFPFNSFRYNLTPAAQVRTLENARRHLARGGRVLVDISIPEQEWSTREKTMTAEFTHEGAEYFLIQSFQLTGETAQVLTVRRRLYENGELLGKVEQEYARIHEREFVHVLERAGFEEWEVYGGFDGRRLAETDEPTTMLWELRVPEG